MPAADAENKETTKKQLEQMSAQRWFFIKKAVTGTMLNAGSTRGPPGDASHASGARVALSYDARYFTK
jgi:hypothetical protein